MESLPGAGVLQFDGAADAFPDDGGSLQRLNELRGIVRSTKETRDIWLDVWVDDDLEQLLGKVRVTILDPNKVFFYDQVQDEYPDVDAFFADLVPGQTLLEVQVDLGLDGVLIGVLIGRAFVVEGDDGAPKYPNEVKFEGYVVGLPADALELAWTKIESGVDLAEPVLGSLGDPAVLTGDVPAGALVLNAKGQEVPASSLAVSQKVEVVFPDFDGLNFLLTHEAFEPFGGGVGPTGPYVVFVDDDCDWQGAAASLAELEALYDGLDPGETIELVVQGIGTANPDEIVAFELDVAVVTP